MPCWAVTGGSGFLGRHLLAALDGAIGADASVVAWGRRCPEGWPRHSFLEVDLCDLANIGRAVDSTEPTLIFHFAGKTPPASSDEMYQSNTLATLYLLEALRSRNRPVRVVLAGSAAELGPVDDEHLPVDEEYPCRPVNAYGLSKYLATMAGLSMRPPLEVIVARIFNPIGRGMPESQAFGRFAARLAEPKSTELTVGDLEARRDFIDVRDVAQALIALALRGRAGLVYHVGTGRSRRVGDGLDHLLRLSGRRVDVRTDPRFAASAGARDSRADVRRIAEHTGWRAQVSWEESLNDVWHSARHRGSH